MTTCVAILKTNETRGEQDLLQAYRLAGAEADVLETSTVDGPPNRLSPYGILILPDGFDAEQLSCRTREAVIDAGRRHRMILGIGTGFQALLTLGLLPCPPWSHPIAYRDVRFQARLEPMDDGTPAEGVARLKLCSCLNRFTFTLGESELSLELAGPRSRLVCDERTRHYIESTGLVAARFLGDDESARAANAIAGLSNPGGTILGLVVRPEVQILPAVLYPCNAGIEPPGFPLFQESVRHAPLC